MGGQKDSQVRERESGRYREANRFQQKTETQSVETINECLNLNDAKKQEFEIVKNPKILIKNFDNHGGLWALLIPIEYKKMFKKDLNVIDIGYQSPLDFLDDKLGDFVQTKKPEKYGDILIFSKRLRC